jgi:hypothetical protein
MERAFRESRFQADNQVTLANRLRSFDQKRTRDTARNLEQQFNTFIKASTLGSLRSTSNLGYNI